MQCSWRHEGHNLYQMTSCFCFVLFLANQDLRSPSMEEGTEKQLEFGVRYTKLETSAVGIKPENS